MFSKQQETGLVHQTHFFLFLDTSVQCLNTEHWCLNMVTKQCLNTLAHNVTVWAVSCIEYGRTPICSYYNYLLLVFFF